jgi:hypothetical protein
MARLSAKRSTRAPGRRNMMPALRCSVSAYPVPSPSTRRPLLSESRVAAARANSTGWWNSLLSTSGPTPNCIVADATTASGMNGSTVPR